MDARAAAPYDRRTMVRSLQKTASAAAIALVLAPLIPLQASDAVSVDPMPWIGRQVIADTVVNPLVGDVFEVDTATIDRIRLAEPHGTRSLTERVVLLEATMGPDAAPSGTRLESSSQSELLLATVTLATVLSDRKRYGGDGTERGADARTLRDLLLVAAQAQADRLVLDVTSDDAPHEGAPERVLLALSMAVNLIEDSHTDGIDVADALFLPWFTAGADAAFAAVFGVEPPTLRETADAIEALAAYRTLASEPGSVDAEIARHVASLTAVADEHLGLLDAANVARGLLVAVDSSTTPSDALAVAIDTVEAAVEEPPASLVLQDLAVLAELVRSAWQLGENGEAVVTDVKGLLSEIVVSSGLLTGLHSPESMFDAVDVDTAPTGALRPGGIPIGPDDHPRFRASAAVDESGAWRADDGLGDLAPTLRLARALTLESHGLEPSSTTDGGEISREGDESTRTSVVVQTTEFAFGPDTLFAEAGAAVTLVLENSGAVPHNISFPDLGVILEAQPGETAELAFTVPDLIGQFSFVCSLPGHAEAGMSGTLTATEPVSESTTTSPQGAIPLFGDGLSVSEDESATGEALFGTISIGVLLLVLVVAVWGLWRLTVALEEPPPSGQAPKAIRNMSPVVDASSTED